MKLTGSLTPKPSGPCLIIRNSKFTSDGKWVSPLWPPGVRIRGSMAGSSTTQSGTLLVHIPSPDILSDNGSGEFHHHALPRVLQNLEENVEKAIYGSRFLTILAVCGSLIGSLLCFIKGCTYVVASYQEYLVSRAKVILLLLEAIDVYLLGTVMLVFGMGLYELFISNLDIAKSLTEERIPYRSNLFGLFTMKERPKWLEIKSVNQLKTKIGHVIVMLLLIGLLEKSKKAVISTPTDLLCFSASVLLSSVSLYLLSMLKGSK